LHKHDYRNLIMGFMHANIPSVNSLTSEYMMLERPVMFAGLLGIRNRLGFKRFPLIDQSFHGSSGELRFTPDYPLVVKVGHVHAGYGKMKLENSKQLDDLRSIVALHNDYCTAETFMKGDYDLRIQRIGDRYRVYKRTGISGGWKTNVGSAILEEIPITTEYKSWADEAEKLFGGLDMFALDSIHTLDGKDYILELNGSAIGLGPEREIDDNQVIRDLVLRKLLDVATTSTSAGSEEKKGDEKDLGLKVQELEVELLNLKNQKHRLQLELQDSKQSVFIPPKVYKPLKSKPYLVTFVASFLVTSLLYYLMRKMTHDA